MPPGRRGIRPPERDLQRRVVATRPPHCGRAHAGGERRVGHRGTWARAAPITAPQRRPGRPSRPPFGRARSSVRAGSPPAARASEAGRRACSRARPGSLTAGQPQARSHNGLRPGGLPNVGDTAVACPSAGDAPQANRGQTPVTVDGPAVRPSLSGRAVADTSVARRRRCRDSAERGQTPGSRGQKEERSKQRLRRLGGPDQPSHAGLNCEWPAPGCSCRGATEVSPRGHPTAGQAANRLAESG
jgi:hypothetical protein